MTIRKKVTINPKETLIIKLDRNVKLLNNPQFSITNINTSIWLDFKLSLKGVVKYDLGEILIRMDRNNNLFNQKKVREELEPKSFDAIMIKHMMSVKVDFDYELIIPDTL